MKTRALQFTLVGASLLVGVGLYLAPSQLNSEPKTTANASLPVAAFDYETLIKTAKASLNNERKVGISALELALNNNPDSIALYDSIGKAWDAASIPAVSAYYFSKKAALVPSEKSYLDAAYRYFDAFKIAADTSLRGYMVQLAIDNYKKVLEQNPANLNAKTDLGACYAEGTADPMKGIMLLREVVTTNPKHEMAQFNLGLLSLKSTQYAKAIERFDKVLAINPKRADVYLYLGQTYLQMGDTANAVSAFSMYKGKSDNYEMIQQVEQLLQELKGTASGKATS